jgi:cholesterol transport system auxiliary component
VIVRISTVLWRLVFVFLCAGCAPFLAPGDIQPIARFDLGPPATTPLAARPWQFDIRVDGSLENTAMRYRLAYANSAQVMAYAQSRWASVPAEVLKRRLEGRLYWRQGSREDACALYLDLLQFEQVFGQPQTSHGILSVRAVLQRGSLTVDSGIFTLEEAAPTPDANGGVKALAAAADRLAQTLMDWRDAGQQRGLHLPCAP